MDLGAIIKAPTQDKDWIKKILLMGVFMLIPIAGGLNALGYIKACYEMRKAGKTELPEASLSYIGAGWWIFVAFLPVIGFMFLFIIVITVLASVMGRAGGIVALLGNLAMLAFGLALWAAAPAIFFLHIVRGERWASMKIKQILAHAQTHMSTYMWLWLTFFLASLIGGAGQVACGIGILFTMPFSYAIQGVALADYEKTGAP
ncbi:hypothetical protein ACFL6C_14590 [Myxococcota bacterium]